MMGQPPKKTRVNREEGDSMGDTYGVGEVRRQAREEEAFPPSGVKALKVVRNAPNSGS